MNLPISYAWWFALVSTVQAEGDESTLLAEDCLWKAYPDTEEEAAGSMRRICTALANTPVRWVNHEGQVSQFTVSVSIGVAEFAESGAIAKAFQSADKASYASKEAGKGTVRRASELPNDG